MCAPFTDEDVGKSVENDEGEVVGVVTSVAETVALVRPTDDASDQPRRVELDSVRAITTDVVRLKGGLLTEDEAVDEKRYRGLEADPTELSGEDGDAVTPDELSAELDEDMESTDAAVDPDEDMESTDATVDPDAASEPSPASDESETEQPVDREDESDDAENAGGTR